MGFFGKMFANRTTDNRIDVLVSRSARQKASTKLVQSLTRLDIEVKKLEDTRQAMEQLVRTMRRGE